MGGECGLSASKLASERPKRFQARCEKAELQAYIDQGYIDQGTERQAQNAAPRIMEQKVLRAGKGQKRAGQFLLKLMSDTLKPS